MILRISILICSLFFNSPQGNCENTLNRGNGSEVDSLNIHQAQGLNSLNVLRDLYEGLMTLDAHGNPIYGVAKSHTVDGNIWTFYLRKDSIWSNGQSIKAGDFVSSWRKAITPEVAAPYAFLFSNIENYKEIIESKQSIETLGVKAIDDFTLQVRLLKPDSSFLEKLSLPIFYPLYGSIYDSKNIISNGAYILDDWRIQEKLELKQNPYYSNQEMFFEKVIYWVTENQSSELKRFRAGELDITESVPDAQISWIEQNLKSSLHIHPYLGTFFLGLNLDNKLLENLEFRKALYFAIDREILTEKVLKSGQQPAFNLVPRQLLVNVNESSNHLNSIELAKKHFQASGLVAEDIKLEILYNNSENQRKVALAVAAMWRQTLGVRSRLVNQEWKVFVQSRKSSHKQVFRSGWIADYADPMSFLELLVSDSRFNFYQFNNSLYDELIINISQQQNPQEKSKLIEQAESIILQEIPIIPLYYYVSRHMVNVEIKGYIDNVSDRHLSKYLYK